MPPPVRPFFYKNFPFDSVPDAGGPGCRSPPRFDSSANQPTRALLYYRITNHITWNYILVEQWMIT